MKKVMIGLLLCSLVITMLSGCRVNISIGTNDTLTGETYPDAEKYQTGAFSYPANKVKAVAVTTGSGNVKLPLTDVPSTEINTSSGDVDLTLPKGGAEVLYTTSSGNLLTDCAYDRKGNLYVFSEGTSAVTVGTSSGNLRIQ